MHLHALGLRQVQQRRVVVAVVVVIVGERGFGLLLGRGVGLLGCTGRLHEPVEQNERHRQGGEGGRAPKPAVAAQRGRRDAAGEEHSVWPHGGEMGF